MFKDFQDFSNQLFKFAFFMFLFVMGLWLFALCEKAFGAEELTNDEKFAREMNEMGYMLVDENNHPVILVPETKLTLMPADKPPLIDSDILIADDAPGQKLFGHTQPSVDKVELKDGLLCIIYRQYPLFTYEDEMPTAHVYREVYHADFYGEWDWGRPVIKLLRVENARVTPPKEIEERIEWP
jgi:hypothetical protein